MWFEVIKNETWISNFFLSNAKYFHNSSPYSISREYKLPRQSLKGQQTSLKFTLLTRSFFFFDDIIDKFSNLFNRLFKIRGNSCGLFFIVKRKGKKEKKLDFLFSIFRSSEPIFYFLFFGISDQFCFSFMIFRICETIFCFPLSIFLSFREKKSSPSILREEI